MTSYFKLQGLVRALLPFWQEVDEGSVPVPRCYS
eukprot:CAMPEP_0195007622 /NCGR_PEP_ID=MMETSP0326_2-20130528/7791_1 /TAXON_ID=2866 ORGANISM="Crypthecodinium cohnii, Strain Seligo" /NCGR_SAMPLE_ID=MMETSP0326_2 /ASSEMBLY_ACC=CAM_ASM_000348 /LENGTH=33 /DNA_ID= /DNA_START= /DNA_END= /DNA_ORIENTATION=